jgi:Na+/proline symporter
MGLVLASLVAAYMSTISTHLNWGSSYVANDFYKRFVKPKASGKELVLVGRISTAVLMVFAGWLALNLKSALDTFQILLQVGAGTGLLFILRWFWWRINAFSELAAMIASFIIAVTFKVVDPGWAWWVELISGIGMTTVIWVTVTLVTPPSEMKNLLMFYKRVSPGGNGWNPVREQSKTFLPRPEALWPQIAQALMGIVSVYGFLFGIGKLIYGEYGMGLILLVVAIGLAVKLITAKNVGGGSKSMFDT